MNTKSIDVPLLLTRRKHKHVIARGFAEGIDFVLLVIASNILVASFGEKVMWVVYPAMLLYFVLMEFKLGFTLGKKVLDLRVVGVTGERPTLSQSLIRNVIRPLEGFGLFGIIVVESTSKGQRVGDLLASTFVVHRGELDEYTQQKEVFLANEHPCSLEVLPLTSNAIKAAQLGISESLNPAETCLRVSESSDGQHEMIVQYDILDIDDESYHWTTDGVAVSVARTIAKKCNELMIDADAGTLIVTSSKEHAE